MTEEVEINCLHCDSLFTTIKIIDNGCVFDHFCSHECGEEYFSKEYIRDRKLQLLLS